jgi:hypothetical protein
MARKILILLAGVAISMGLGGLVALWQCSQGNWCPRYLRRRLDAWRKRMERQNDERHSLRLIPRDDSKTGSDPEKD